MSTPDELDAKVNQMTNQDKKYLVKLLKRANRRSKAKWFLAGAAAAVVGLFAMPCTKNSEIDVIPEPDPE